MDKVMVFIGSVIGLSIRLNQKNQNVYLSILSRMDFSFYNDGFSYK